MAGPTSEDEYAINEESLRQIETMVLHFCGKQTKKLKNQLKMWQKRHTKNIRAMTLLRSRNVKLKKFILAEHQKIVQNTNAPKTTEPPTVKAEIDLTQDVEMMKAQVESILTKIKSVLPLAQNARTSTKSVPEIATPIASTSTAVLDSVVISDDSDDTSARRNAPSSSGISTFKIDNTQQTSTPKTIKRPRPTLNRKPQYRDSSSYASSSDDDGKQRKKKKFECPNLTVSSSCKQSQSHSKKPRFECPKCGGKFVDFADFTYHVVRCMELLKCPVCGMVYKTESNLRTHQRKLQHFKIEPKWKKEE